MLGGAAMPTIKRGLFGLVLLMACCTAAAAQEAPKFKVGFLTWRPPQMTYLLDALRQGLADHGYVEGKNLQPIFTGHQARMVPPALAAGLAVVADYPQLAEAGALLSYVIDDAALVRRAGYYADCILKGDAPGDLPIERPTRFKLTINLNTAKALGVEVPPSLLARTDEVIE